MANNIKGITIEIGGDTTKLQNALKGVKGDLKSTKNELKEVEKGLKLDPKNTELLAQKQQLLTKAVGETKDKLDVLKTAEAQVEQQFKNGEASEEQYRCDIGLFYGRNVGGFISGIGDDEVAMYQQMCQEKPDMTVVTDIAKRNQVE